MDQDTLWLLQRHLRTMKDDLFPNDWAHRIQRRTRPWQRLADEQTMQTVSAMESDRALRNWIQTQATDVQVMGLFQQLTNLTSFLLIADDEPERQDRWATEVSRPLTARNALDVAWRFVRNADAGGQ